MVPSEHNPHAGRPFTDDDHALAAYLEDVSIPALMCAMVHVTGDPSWIRGEIKPQAVFLNEYQGFMGEEMKAEARRRALAALVAYRDGGCVLPPQPSAAVLHEMMEYLACGPVEAEVVPMFLEDLHLDGADSGAITWREEIPEEIRSAAHVVVIGAGESGLLAGIRLQQAGLPFTIIEKNPGPGGTWFDNRYPGARVDIGSHFYCYSFEPSDHWSEYFCQQPELKAYFERVMHKYGLESNTRFRTEVLGASWQDETRRWAVEVRNPDGSTETLDALAVISAVGALNQPKMPDIPGIEEFEGPLFHSARWPEGLDIAGTRFALIGAGASGFQIAPTIADEVEHLDIYQRTAQWVMPNANYHRQVPAGEVWAMQHLPFYARWFRFLMFWPGAGLSIEGSRVDPDHDDSDGLAISAQSRERRAMFEQFLVDGLGGRADLVEKVMPHYPVSAKRMLQDNGVWLGCLTRDDVELIRTPIERITPEGVVTADGVLRPADVICCATGFRHNDFLWPIEFRGRGGVRLRDQFGEEPKAYLGITIPNFPNLFCLYGPGTNLAHGASLIFQSESQVAYIMSALRQLLTTGARAVEPRLDVHEDYAERYQSEISQMVWAHWSVKHSHFKNSEGRIWTISPWPIPDYWRWCHDFRPEDYIWA